MFAGKAVRGILSKKAWIWSHWADLIFILKIVSQKVTTEKFAKLFVKSKGI